MRQYVKESHKENNKNVSRILEDVVLADCYNGLWVFWEISFAFNRTTYYAYIYVRNLDYKRLICSIQHVT